MASERLEPSTSSAVVLCSSQIPYVEFKKLVSQEIRHETEITNLKQIVIAKDEEIESIKSIKDREITVAIKKVVISKNEEIAILQNEIASLKKKNIAKEPFSDFRQKHIDTINDELTNSIVYQFPPIKGVTNRNKCTITEIIAEALKYNSSLIRAESHVVSELLDKKWKGVQCVIGLKHLKVSTGYYLVYKVDSVRTLQVFWTQSY